MKKLIYLLPLIIFSGCSGAGFSGGKVFIPIIAGVLTLFFIARLVIGAGGKKLNGWLALSFAAVTIFSYFSMLADN